MATTATEKTSGSSGIRLYGWPRSSAAPVHWALEELGLPYEYVVLDRKKGEHRSPEYLAINPNGKVPGLVDGGQPLFESSAIIIHLGERYGRERGLWPTDEAGRAEALCWTVWGRAELNLYMMQYAYHGLDTPVSYRPEDRSKATAEFNGAQFRWLLDVLERRLAGRDYLLGSFTLADIPAAGTLAFGTALGVSVDGHPAVRDWLDRCRARPALARLNK
jgi:glutathione S-transferase